ncbi:MAG: YXWGXW repeat-containing protein [Polyangiaceae bacterium]
MNPRAPLRALGVTLLGALIAACGSSLPVPPAGRVPDNDMQEVPYPPPPARVETIPPQETRGAVWIDGQWDWNGRDWRWTDGQWVIPPQGAAYFTPWTTARRPDGRLLFARATWRAADGSPVPPVSGDCGVGAPPPAEAPPQDPERTAGR